MDGSPVLDVLPLGAHALGDYQLVAEIGRGGMADVYLALTPSKNGQRDQVVIKKLRSDVLEEDDFRAMFLDEARLAEKLHHPNVVKTLEVGKDGDAFFIVMEVLDGQPLSRMRRHSRKTAVEIPMAVHLRILADVLAGLHYVHDLADHDGVTLGVVHRDVTPQNIFVTYDGEVKVVDFGIAKARARQVETRVGVVKGKLSYIAPENVRGEPVDRRSDIFSVGVMLWEAAAGKRFWDSLDELAIYQRLVSGDLPTASGAGLMSPQVFSIVKRALAPRPDDRFATAAQMQSAISALLPPESVSRSMVSASVQELFQDERRRFHQFIQDELERLDAGEWPIELPDLRSDTLPTSAPVANPSARDGATVRPGAFTPQSARTSPTVISFSSPSAESAGPGSSLRARLPLLFAAAVVGLLVAVYALDQSQSAARMKSNALAAGRASQEAAPPAALVPTTSIAAVMPTIDHAPPAATATAPAILPRSLTTFARPLSKKPEAPELTEEIHHEARRKRSLDAEDPWAK